MARKQQVQKSNTPEADAEQDQAAEQAAETVATDADAKPMHSNLAVSQFKFRKVKTIALPLFKLIPNTPCFVLVDGAMYLGKKVDENREAATLMHVTDLENGEQGQIIVGKVLHDLIQEAYPENVYVGKKFTITLRKRADKKYNTYDFAEIETEE